MVRINKLPVSVLELPTVTDRRAVLQYLAVTSARGEGLKGKFTVVRPDRARCYYVQGGSEADNQTISELIQSSN